jgi:membrane-associated phospholipid phosphatase
LPDYNNDKTPNRRTFDLRSRETNCSLPSGDAAQASLFSFLLMNNFPKAFWIFGGPFGTAQFVLAVGFARMYFHCHWFGDIVAGLLIGTGVGLCVFKLGTKAMLKNLWL